MACSLHCVFHCCRCFYIVISVLSVCQVCQSSRFSTSSVANYLASQYAHIAHGHAILEQIFEYTSVSCRQIE